MKVLYVHRTSGRGLGDSIREQAILDFLKKDPLLTVNDVSLPIPHLSMRNMVSFISCSSPTSTFPRAYQTLRDLPFAAMFNTFHNRLRRSFQRQAFDVVISETTPVGWLTSLLLKQHHISVPHIVDVHGLWYAEERESGGKTWTEVKRREAEALERATYVFVVSDAMKKLVEKEFQIQSKKMIVVPNGAPAPGAVSEYYAPLKVIYAGIFDHYENLPKYLELARKCDYQRVRFSMAGSGPLLRRVLNEIKHKNIPIRYLGYIPRNIMLDLLAHFSVGAIFSSNDTARKVAFPIKILDYASRGLPLIAPKVGDWGRLIEEEEIGFSVEGSIADYVNAIRRLVNQHVWVQMSRNAIAFAKQHEWPKVLQPISECLCGIRS